MSRACNFQYLTLEMKLSSFFVITYESVIDKLINLAQSFTKFVLLSLSLCVSFSLSSILDKVT